MICVSLAFKTAVYAVPQPFKSAFPVRKAAIKTKKISVFPVHQTVRPARVLLHVRPAIQVTLLD